MADYKREAREQPPPQPAELPWLVNVWGPAQMPDYPGPFVSEELAEAVFAAAPRLEFAGHASTIDWSIL